ncbi:hypothetical protein Dimus_039419 [Dionaea muscipula]
MRLLHPSANSLPSAAYWLSPLLEDGYYIKWTLTTPSFMGIFVKKFRRPPPGYMAPDDTRVCRLHKSLYGLRQTSRQWFKKFTSALLQYGCQQSRADYSLFTLQRDGNFLIILVYVDDVLLACSSTNLLQDVKKYIDNQFHVKDLGSLKYFLGIEVAINPSGIFVNQRKYITDLLQEARLGTATAVDFPMEQRHSLDPTTGTVLLNPSSYRRLIGRLICLTITRPDISYSVQILIQFMHTPRQPHMAAAKRLLRYLHGSSSKGLWFPAKSTLQVSAFCDSDWGTCLQTRRSITGYYTTLGTAPLSWKSKKRSTVAKSSVKAKYRAMASTTCELLWLRSVLTDLGVSMTSPIWLYCDSQAALHIASNPVFLERTKHIKIDCHLVREHLQTGLLQPSYISTHDQLTC